MGGGIGGLVMALGAGSLNAWQSGGSSTPFTAATAGARLMHPTQVARAIRSRAPGRVPFDDA
jgi:hypothetical protein